MDATIHFSVNGQQRTVTTDPRRPLLDVLREDLQLTGTKYGCGEGKCGACTVLVDGERAFSCQAAVGDLAGKAITTIEGLAKPTNGNANSDQGDHGDHGGPLHPVQE